MRVSRKGLRLISIIIMVALLMVNSTLMGVKQNKVYAVSTNQNIRVETLNGHSFAIKDDGSLWAWGLCWYINSDREYQPIPVKFMDNVKSIASGYTMFALKKDNTLWSWGTSPLGALGDGTNGDSKNHSRKQPAKIMDHVVAIDSHSNHAFAIKEDGTLWGWGENQYGQIGDGTLENKNKPVKIMDDVKQVSAGFNHTLAIKNDGSLWGWGRNNQNQIIDGSRGNITKPVKIMNDIIDANAGSTQSLAVKKDGSLWGWGFVSEGILGPGTDNVYNAPTKIIDDVKSAVCNGANTFIIKNDNTLWALGINNNGQMGIGIPSNRIENGATIMEKGKNYYDIPQKVMDDVVYVTHDTQATLVIKKDGTVWGWGYNKQCQVGDGTKENLGTPAKIMNLSISDASTIKVVINAKKVQFNNDLGYPFVDNNGRTQVPFRATLEAFGAKVEWDNSKGMAFATKGSTTVYVPLNKNYIIVNGVEVPNDTTAVVADGRTYCPIRKILEAFGANVSWDTNSNSVIVASTAEKIPVVFVPGTLGCFPADECNEMVDWYQKNYDSPGMPMHSLPKGQDLARKAFNDAVSKIRNLDEYSSNKVSMVNGKKYYIGFLDDTYDSIISELDNLNYIKDKNLFLFGYDTVETSISSNADNLRKYINNVLKITGASKVNLIAHSQGNLVARKYIQDSYISYGEKIVNKFIMISPPNTGVMKSEGMLKYGDPKTFEPWSSISLTCDLQLSKYLSYYYVFSKDSVKNKNNWYSMEPISTDKNKPWDLRRWANNVALSIVDMAPSSSFVFSLNSSKGINALFSSVGKSNVYVVYGLNDNNKITVNGYDAKTGNSIPGYGDNTVALDSLSALDIYIDPRNQYIDKGGTHGDVCSYRSFLSDLFLIVKYGK